MATRRWNPWQDWMRMQEELGRTFGRVFGPEMAPAGFWMPATDVIDKEDRIIVMVDLPNVDPDDIDISVVDNTLRVKGERKQEKEMKEEEYYRMERIYGSFERTIDLPVAVKTEDIEAKYKNGTLEIVLPKAEERKPKEIKVKVA